MAPQKIKEKIPCSHSLCTLSSRIALTIHVNFMGIRQKFGSQKDEDTALKITQTKYDIPHHTPNELLQLFGFKALLTKSSKFVCQKRSARLGCPSRRRAYPNEEGISRVTT